MQVIKKKIRYKGQSAYIDFNLDSNEDFIGYQQSIDNLTSFKTMNVVNDVVDAEKRKFNFSNESGSQIIKFWFLNPSKVHQNTFTAAGFTQDEITNTSKSLLNSFFILDFYNTPIIAKQKKLFTSYLTKVLNQSTLPTYTIPLILDESNRNELYYMYISRSYINQQTQPIITGYTKISFFSGHDGSIKTFQYNGFSYSSSQQKLFMRTELNFSGRTWRFIPSSNTIDLYQLDGGEYDNRMNDTFDKENITNPSYNSNKIFDYRDRTYKSEDDFM